ncbi:hypothetical protein EJB05_55847 [Eragrostis curvula]|uniref:Uncharacterized protein n=1 Tax=Eragrostis curvula TaxID=38414 RepID=A0A5J9SII5_9POAL|nr:hypothetical protein EJB05_55847 [Eragrostis curvula]
MRDCSGVLLALVDLHRAGRGNMKRYIEPDAIFGDVQERMTKPICVNAVQNSGKMTKVIL